MSVSEETKFSDSSEDQELFGMTPHAELDFVEYIDAYIENQIHLGDVATFVLITLGERFVQSMRQINIGRHSLLVCYDEEPFSNKPNGPKTEFTTDQELIKSRFQFAIDNLLSPFDLIPILPDQSILIKGSQLSEGKHNTY